MPLLSILKTILSLFPLIIQTVQAVEAAFPAAGQGSAKLDAVKNTIASAYSIASNAEHTFEAIWPALSSVVSTIVSLANTVGAFKTSAPSPDAAQQAGNAASLPPSMG